MGCMSFSQAVFLPKWAHGSVGLILSTLLPALLLAVAASADGPSSVIDLATIDDDDPMLSRVWGASGDGHLGVPVAGGPDVDGDGFADMAVAYFQADPFGRNNAGEVNLIFGDGTLGGDIDSAQPSDRILRLAGEMDGETAGSEIWLDDVTGDGLGDLLICRQNFSPELPRLGAGALTLIAGAPGLRQRAAQPGPVDLGALPNAWDVTTFIGAKAFDRLGIWVRTGDVTGDGVADIVVGADQISRGLENHGGAVYLIRGGPHLLNAGVIDLEDFGTTVLAGHLARIDPPPLSNEYHFGATTQIADLDDNGRGEVLVAATLLRGGALLEPPGSPPDTVHSTGGTEQGTLFIAWDDNIPAGSWPAGWVLDMGALPGSRTVLDGGPGNERFGEEILGGLDFDGDGRSDLFVGDIAGDPSEGVNGERSGSGHIFYHAAQLRSLDLDLDALPNDLTTTTVLGPILGALGGDTAAQGDFDADGFADLAFAAPHGRPQARRNAGQVFLLYGQTGGWPTVVDTRAGQLPSADLMRILEIQGANGNRGSDTGDTLAYSGAAADLDGDGRTDLISNEMVGNGVDPEAVDVGNLIALSGRLLSGDEGPVDPCQADESALCLNGERFRVEVSWRDFAGSSGVGQVVPASTDDSGLFWFFSANNWEMLAKVIDGCDFNQRVWVFAAAITNVEYRLRVTDTVSGEVKEYFNPLGESAAATTDIDAFAACP